MGTSRFVAAGTNIPPNLPTTALVVDGIYGRTRNLLYLGTTLIYLGLSVAAGSLWAIVLVVPLLWVINVGVIARKDRLAQVPKWVSIFTHPTQECFVMQRKEMNCWPCAPRYGEWRSKYCARYIAIVSPNVVAAMSVQRVGLMQIFLDAPPMI
jgi:hypothetical protein